MSLNQSHVHVHTHTRTYKGMYLYRLLSSHKIPFSLFAASCLKAGLDQAPDPFVTSQRSSRKKLFHVTASKTQLRLFESSLSRPQRVQPPLPPTRVGGDGYRQPSSQRFRNLCNFLASSLFGGSGPAGRPLITHEPAPHGCTVA